jgi:hypothetical protein
MFGQGGSRKVVRFYFQPVLGLPHGEIAFLVFFEFVSGIFELQTPVLGVVIGPGVYFHEIPFEFGLEIQHGFGSAAGVVFLMKKMPPERGREAVRFFTGQNHLQAFFM